MTTNTTLIVARTAAGSLDDIAGIFADSDSGPLPGRLGVERRCLYYFHGLYFHLIESSQNIAEELDSVRQSAEFTSVNERLRPFITPYVETWQGPRDAMARQFYDWTAPAPAGRLA